jgi:hypothetical protein
MTAPAKHRIASIAALFAAYVAAMAVVLHEPILSGFDLGFGDRADSIIEISLLEHWHRVFTSGETWRQTLYFYPYVGTIGYNDGYFLFGVVYSVWRHWFDPFLADTLNVATWKTLGFFASYVLARRILCWERPVALLLATLFTIANGMTVQSLHAQLQSVALLPVVAILTLLLIRSEQAGERRKAALLAVGLAALLGLWFMTGFYLAFFTLYFVLILGLCWLWTTRHTLRKALSAVITAHWQTGLVFALSFALAVVPFLIAYLPKLRETGGQGFGQTYHYLVTPLDIANVGPDNLVWGWIFRTLRALGADEHSIGAEHETGFPLILLGLVLTSIWITLRRRPADFSPALRLYALAVTVSWALTIKLWYLVPWSLVYLFVPGATGMRVVLRYQLWLILPILLQVGSVWRSRFMDLARRRPAVALGIAALLLVEQLNGMNAAKLSRRKQLAEFGSLAPMPAECPAFYVVSARAYREHYISPVWEADYPHNVDAMLLSGLWGRPTVNGYSTFNPPDWNFSRPDLPSYDGRVATYARAHGLRMLCRLDARISPMWRVVRYDGHAD